MRVASLILAATALSLPAAAALAPSETGRAAYGRFKALDTDRDRRLTQAELLVRGRDQASEILFRLLDADADGVLRQGEVRGPAARRIASYDANNDKMVTRAEFPETLDYHLFTALDGDGDRAVELRDMRPQFAGWRPRAEAPSVGNEPQARAEAERPWCWVPVLGDDGWWVVAPITSAECRLSP